MVFTPAQWRSVRQEKFLVSAAPFGPGELGRNSKYVFALPPRYDYSFPPGYEEVEEIMGTLLFVRHARYGRSALTMKTWKWSIACR